ncbi:hypothetical protein [Streptomyces antimycoticus]|uniref:hypothetical protein n=1 Tax=Streptomyces antimycoticus TaxID=68175 RepID=UPI00191BBE10|nr:hypothetical protein [Streptomyces antimycoticus]
MTNFIFMLTRDDRTVHDAHELADVAADAGVTHIGFKDIGLPLAELGTLASHIKDRGATSYLEVVSTTVEDELRSIRCAIDLGVDYVLGGTNPELGAEILRGTPIRYFPFAGEVVGHPSVLAGPPDDIVESARRVTAIDGVHGIDLLAYRFGGDVERLVSDVVAAISLPVIAAGSVDSSDRVRALQRAGAEAFTIGTALIDGTFQIQAASKALGDLAGAVLELG